MFYSNFDFAYASRRAQQEQVAAINAQSNVAAALHRRLSGLFAIQAVLAFIGASAFMIERDTVASPAELMEHPS